MNPAGPRLSPSPQPRITLVVNYRLTPTVRHPGHVQDAARATAWALENVERFGGRKDRVFLSGRKPFDSR